MAVKIKWRNFGLLKRANGMYKGRKDVLRHIQKIGLVILASDMSYGERQKLLNIFEKEHKILYMGKDKEFLNKIIGGKNFVVIGISKKFVELIMEKEEKSDR